jgi:hypothetical protein
MTERLLPHEARRRRERRVRIARAGSIVRDGVRALAGVAIVAALLGFATEIWLRRTWTPSGAGEVVASPVSATRAMQTNLQQRRIEAAIVVFRLRNGAIPASLTQLVDDGLLAENELREPGYERAWFYRPAGSVYVLMPPAY